MQEEQRCVDDWQTTSMVKVVCSKGRELQPSMLTKLYNAQRLKLFLLTAEVRLTCVDVVTEAPVINL